MKEATKRAQEIAAMWQTTSESGVIVHPIRAAVQAMVNRGCEMSAALSLLSQAERLYSEGEYDRLLAKIALINKEIILAIQREDAHDPHILEELRARLPSAMARIPGEITFYEYLDKVKGAWVGKCIGTAFGDPVEGWTSEMIRSCHGSVTNYLACPKVENDDTAYPILVLHALEEHGPSFTSEQLALEWVEHLPHAFTAEWVALENLKAGVMPPQSGKIRNPCSEWVGAQMRGEVHGLLAPLHPGLAMDLAFRDAIISHQGEGVYGEIYCAALISIAFSGRPIAEILRLGLSFVPPESRFYHIVESTIHWCNKLGDWEGVLPRIKKELGTYHWIHTFPNIATAITGLLLGEGNFEKSITTTFMCGYDTDCSTGQVGALLGTILGWQGIPEKWKGPIGEVFESYVIGFEQMGFDRLSEWTVRLGRQIAGNAVREN